jgi:hypothetical protein
MRLPLCSRWLSLSFFCSDRRSNELRNTSVGPSTLVDQLDAAEQRKPGEAVFTTDPGEP